MKLNNEKFILILIIILAAFLRLVALNKVPASFHQDELLSSYEAYSVLTTGRDQWGNFLPLRFKAFGDWPPPLYFYFNLPFVLIFGLKEIVIRLPAALLGIFTVFFTFLLTKELFKNKTVALLASFLMAISPWHLQYSRLGWPAIMVPFLITLGLWFFFSGINSQKSWRICLGLFFISLSVWVYTPAQVFILLFLLGLLIFYKNKVEKKVIFYGLAVSLIILLPLYVLIFFHPEWQARFNQISIFQIEPIDIAHRFFNNYLSHLSPSFLFFSGDANLRHNIKGMGQIYLFEMIALTYLIIYLIVKKKIFLNFPFLFYWFFIFPISSSLTIEGIPHATRTITALPLLHIFSAFGLYLIISFLKNKFLKGFLFFFILITITIVIFFSFILFALNYYLLYPRYSAPWFDYGQKEVVEYLKENYKNYEKFIICSEKHLPHYLYFLFYLGYNPKKFHSEVKKIETKEIVIVTGFDKFEFEFEPEKIKEFLPKTLYLVKGYQKLPLKTKKIIYFPDGSIAYRILSLE